MSKQTRLNFQRTPAAPAKRRRLDSNDETDDGELENSSSSQGPKPQSRASVDTKEAKPTNNTSPQNTSSQQQKPKPSSDSKSASRTQSGDSTSTSPSSPQSHTQNVAKSSTKSTPTNPSPPASHNQPPNHLTNSHLSASLFASPPNTVLCHATNAQGTWGAGIAAAFKTHYPSAFKLYFAHCKKWPSITLLGTTLLIPPQLKSSSKAEREAHHWIGCLFTSEKKGKGKGSKESILKATGEAVADLIRRVGGVSDDSGEEGIVGVRMCKINSGLFGVPWEASKAVIEGIEIEEGSGSGVREIVVCSVD